MASAVYVTHPPFETPTGEYLGMGLSFMLREGSWRLEALDNTVLARDANSIGISMQLGSRLGIEDIEGYAGSWRADLPPAPMPPPETDQVLVHPLQARAGGQQLGGGGRQRRPHRVVGVGAGPDRAHQLGGDLGILEVGAAMHVSHLGGRGFEKAGQRPSLIHISEPTRPS